MAVRCCWPPESSSTSWPAWAARPSCSRASAVPRRASAGVPPVAIIATATFSAAVRMVASPLSCGTITTRRATPWSRSRSFSPSTSTVPAAGASSPAIAASRVVLPAPEVPVTASISPGPAVTLTSRSTVVAP